MQPATHLPRSNKTAWFQAGLLLLVSTGAIASLSLRPPPGAEAVAAIFPPWWSARQVMSATAQAGAFVIRSGAIPAIMVVQPAQNDGLRRLQAAGAWFAVDPRAIAACSSNPTATRSEGSGA